MDTCEWDLIMADHNGDREVRYEADCDRSTQAWFSSRW